MTLSAEITIYFIALVIVIGMSFITHSVISMHKRFNARIEALKNQLMTLILTTPAKGSKTKVDQYLSGDITMTHPVTGEKLKARAKFKISDK